MSISRSPLPSDGRLRYRCDPATGRTVVVMPASCRHHHDLASVGYRASESRGQLRVVCSECVAEGRDEPQWVLDTSPGAVSGAELDDGPYGDLAREKCSPGPAAATGSTPAPPVVGAPPDNEVQKVTMRRPQLRLAGSRPRARS